MSYKDAYEAEYERSERYYNALLEIRQCFPNIFAKNDFEAHKAALMGIAEILEEFDI